MTIRFGEDRDAADQRRKRTESIIKFLIFILFIAWVSIVLISMSASMILLGWIPRSDISILNSIADSNGLLFFSWLSSAVLICVCIKLIKDIEKVVMFFE